MKIFPAVDIKDKKCVRVIRANFGQKKGLKILENFLKWEL